jgi:putative hemolysin
MLKNPNRLLGTTLVGTNLTVIIASSLCTEFLYSTYGTKSEWLTTLILSPVVLLFGEFIPKAIFAQSADRITFYLASVLAFFWKIFYPIVWLVTRFVNLILGVFVDTSITSKKSPFVTREEIKYLIKESESEGEIDPNERNIIYKIFDFGNKKAKDIMKDLSKLVYFTESDTIGDILAKAREVGYSRFPVRNEVSAFSGIINILDVVYETDKNKPLKKFLRPIEFIDVNMSIDNTLFHMQSKNHHLAIVKDPQGNTTGFLTLQDLFEELLGEI